MKVSGKHTGSRAKIKREERDSDQLHLAWILEPDTKWKIGAGKIAQEGDTSCSSWATWVQTCIQTEGESWLHKDVLWPWLLCCGMCTPPPHSNWWNAKWKLVYACVTIWGNCTSLGKMKNSVILGKMVKVLMWLHKTRGILWWAWGKTVGPWTLCFYHFGHEFGSCDKSRVQICLWNSLLSMIRGYRQASAWATSYVHRTGENRQCGREVFYRFGLSPSNYCLFRSGKYNNLKFYSGNQAAISSHCGHLEDSAVFTPPLMLEAPVMKACRMFCAVFFSAWAKKFKGVIPLVSGALNAMLLHQPTGPFQTCLFLCLFSHAL